MIETSLPSEIAVGERIRFRARVRTGPLSTDDLKVELYAGRLNAHGEIEKPLVVEMQPAQEEAGATIYETTAVPDCGSGRHGYTARVLPRHPELRNAFIPGLILWANGAAGGTDRAQGPEGKTG